MTPDDGSARIHELFEDPSMEGFGWFFFRGPDGNVYIMQQDQPTRPNLTLQSRDYDSAGRTVTCPSVRECHPKK